MTHSSIAVDKTPRIGIPTEEVAMQQKERNSILEQFLNMPNPLELRIEALEEEVKVLKILCTKLAERCQANAST